jgi:hypothetical protein
VAKELIVRITFSVDERERLAKICQALNTTFAEFVHYASMQSVDEMEGLSREFRKRGIYE